jgi:hypothetical protein
MSLEGISYISPIFRDGAFYHATALNVETLSVKALPVKLVNVTLAPDFDIRILHHQQLQFLSE